VQAVPISDQDHRRIPPAVAVCIGSLGLMTAGVRPLPALPSQQRWVPPFQPTVLLRRHGILSATVATFCEPDIAYVFKRAFYFKRESLDAVSWKDLMRHSGQHNAPAVATQRARLLADSLRIYVGLLPTWQAEYFDREGGQTQRCIIAAENVAIALEEVRARMAPTCSRAEVIKLDPKAQ
jgi:hypothetical protein